MSRIIKLFQSETIAGKKRKKGDVLGVSSSIFNDLVVVKGVAKEYSKKKESEK